MKCGSKKLYICTAFQRQYYVSAAKESLTMRGGAVVARRAHNPKVIGSSPVPATNTKPSGNGRLSRFMHALRLRFVLREIQQALYW
jgi:hypothetical protein